MCLLNGMAQYLLSAVIAFPILLARLEMEYLLSAAIGFPISLRVFFAVYKLNLTCRILGFVGPLSTKTRTIVCYSCGVIVLFY